MSTSETVPTAQEFLIETPLYEIADLEQGRLLRYFDETFDSYCPQCNSHSIFERYWQYSKSIGRDQSSWIDCRVFSIQIQCTRDRRHKQLFIFKAIGQTIQHF